MPGKVQSAYWRYDLDPERFYALLPDVTLEAEPGTTARYSNLGFGLLGHALELAAKNPLNELFQEHICKPLGLAHTALHVDADLLVVTGYSTPPPLPERASYQHRLAGSGGLVTSAGDLAKFLAAHMKPGTFSSNTLATLHTPTKLKNGALTRRALGWSIDGDQAMLSKNGGRNKCSAWIDFAKVAPFSGIRWENDQPIDRVQGRWSPLASIDGIPVDRIMTRAKNEFGEQARMRFGEDLPELLATMGHNPDWEVTLGLKSTDGKVEEAKVRMTEADREQVRDK